MDRSITCAGPVRWFAEHQPTTSIVNALRDLLTARPVGSDVWVALAWCVCILLAAAVVAVVTYGRRVR